MASVLVVRAIDMGQLTHVWGTCRMVTDIIKVAEITVIQPMTVVDG